MRFSRFGTLAFCLMMGLVAAGCGDGGKDASAGAPPPLKVEQASDPNVFQVDHPDQFPLVAAVEHSAAPQLKATGTVTPDISRNVPVISVATGRVVEIAARLGDTVTKGQLLLRVQSADIAGAYSDYQKAVADEQLTRTQMERAQLLYDKGAISLNDLQIAKDTDTKAKVDVKTAAEKLRVLGSTNLEQPSGIIEIRAPVSGVITEQQVTNASGVAGLGSPNPFTISDLSYVWIMCDVYENDLDAVRLGEYADVHLNAYPNRALKGRIDNIFPILDPSIHTAKVRLEVPNPGQMMRIGMFVTATFYGKTPVLRAAVPASAILHLHDRDWVFVAADDKAFRRVEITSGIMLPGNMQEVISGIQPGTKLIRDALVFQNTVEQ